jgi:hypothetical protein
MYKLRLAALISVFAVALTACGGSSGNSAFATPPPTSSTKAGVASITLVSSMPQIPSDNSKPATITAIVKDTNNAVVTGAAVVFSTDSGVIAPVQTTSTATAGSTDSNGEAAVTLSTPGDPSNRTINVTAAVGSVNAKIAVAVVGTKLTVTGPTSLIMGANGLFSVALTDSSGTGITGIPVTIASSNKNTLSAGSITTDASGHGTFTLTAANSGADTVSASAMALKATQALTVSAQNFTFTSPAANTQVVLGASQVVSVNWTNNGAPVANQPVAFATTKGTLSTASATTDANGNASVTISSTSSGPGVVTASNQAQGVSAQLTLQFIATQAAKIDVQASPATIPTSGSSTITAIVWDPQGNLVQGQTVDFQLMDKTGGQISVATAQTDSQGRAQTVYQATSTQSSSNGVTITATVQGTAVSGTSTLTVGGQTVFLSLGTGSVVGENQAKTQFVLPYVIQALDSGGNAVPGVSVTVTIHSFPQALVPAPLNTDGSAAWAFSAYAKGTWTLVGGGLSCNGGMVGTSYCQHITATCYNEDSNGSGVLQSPSEDVNGNGVLDPKDVAAVSPGTVTTDSTGTANINVTYPEDHAGWVHVLMTATATVSGTESSTSTQFWLPMLAQYVNSTTATPPGYLSPYGVASTCLDPN